MKYLYLVLILLLAGCASKSPEVDPPERYFVEVRRDSASTTAILYERNYETFEQERVEYGAISWGMAMPDSSIQQALDALTLLAKHYQSP